MLFYVSRTILFLAMMMGASASLFAQQKADADTRLVVKAIDAAQNGALIVGARVVLISGKTKISGITNTNGEFIVRLERKNNTITVSAPFYDHFERRNLRIRRLPLSVNADLIPSEISSHNN